MEKYDYVPEELKALIRWICYKLVPGKDKNGNPKIDKVPKNPHNGYTASSTDPDVWSDFNTAVAAVEKYNLDGIGFQFQDSGYIGIDIDHCINDDGTLSEMAKDVVTTLNSYTEYSPSGTGLHIIMKGKKPGERCKSKKNPETGEMLEIYDSGRFLTVTGNVYKGGGVNG